MWERTITLRGTTSAGNWANVWAWNYSGVPTLTPDQIADRMYGFWDTHLSINLPLDVTLTEVECRLGPFASGVSTFPSQGKLTGASLPPNTALLIRKLTPAGFPVGRLYQVGIRETDVDDSGAVDPLWVQQIEDAWRQVVLSMGLDEIALGVASTVNGVDEFNPLESPFVRCDSRVATQRRRLRR